MSVFIKKISTEDLTSKQRENFCVILDWEYWTIWAASTICLNSGIQLTSGLIFDITHEIYIQNLMRKARFDACVRVCLLLVSGRGQALLPDDRVSSQSRQAPVGWRLPPHLGGAPAKLSYLVGPLLLSGMRLFPLHASVTHNIQS